MIIKAQWRVLSQNLKALHFGVGTKRTHIKDFEEKSCSWDRQVGLQNGSNGSNQLPLHFCIYATH